MAQRHGSRQPLRQGAPGLSRPDPVSQAWETRMQGAVQPARQRRNEGEAERKARTSRIADCLIKLERQDTLAQLNTDMRLFLAIAVPENIKQILRQTQQAL